MGIKASEGFLDLVAITDTATGFLKTGLSPTCTLYKISDGSSTSLTVAELGSTGLYKVTNLTFGTATEYVTVWAVAGAYTIHYPFKLFKVGGGQEADLYTDTQALVGRLTATRAGYLDNLSAGAIALNSDMATVLTRLSAARAGYLDNLSVGAVALNSDMATLLTRVSAAVALNSDMTTVLSRLSAARAGYLDNLSAGAVALASVCTSARLTELDAANLPADVDTLIARLTAARAGYLDNINNASLAGIVVASSKVNSQVKGIDDIDFPATQKTSLETAVDNGLDNAIGASPTAGSVAERIKTLDDAYTAARGAYLDKLANHQIVKTFFSDVDDVIDLPAAATDTDLPDIVLPNITGTIDHVYVGIKARMIENISASGANAIQTAQNIRIKKSSGAWDTDDVIAINLIDNQWTVAASTREGGDVHVGDNDVVGEVDAFNATYNLRIDSANVDYDFLRLNDVQVFLIVHHH